MIEASGNGRRKGWSMRLRKITALAALTSGLVFCTTIQGQEAGAVAVFGPGTPLIKSANEVLKVLERRLG